MSMPPALDPTSKRCESTPAIATIIDGRERDIGAFSVRRLLPSAACRLVGPFIFFDHMGPATLPPGEGLDVRPHPHINLATVTYLFEGEIVHRDSLGYHQTIRPGAINWMTAGRGIVHSERTGEKERARAARVHGIQLWIALPTESEEVEPEFSHHPADTLPALERDGVRLRVLAGAAYGVTSPVHVFSPLFYVEALVPAGGRLELPAEYPERAVYVAEGGVQCGPEHAEAGRMLVLSPGAAPRLESRSGARVMLLGGAPIDGERHIWWNFVSSSKERLEQAKRDWKEGRFPKVPGDEDEYIPLPE
jgi:redox-sensitive bicupin YhaK (pirin superfamily)